MSGTIPDCSLQAVRIPKRIIHIYCAPSGADGNLPLFNQASLQNARLLHPDFDHVLFNRERMRDFLDTEFPEFRQAFDSFPHPIQRFDFFRYLAVYRLGGFYFDLDIFLARSLHSLLGQECVFPFEELTLSTYLRRTLRFDWELANYGFGAAPGNAFVAKIIENCVRAQRDPDWAGQMLKGIPAPFRGSFFVPVMTGPGMVSRTFAENPTLQEGLTLLFPEDVCDERSWQRFGDFGVHLMQASWRKRDGFIRRRLARLWENRKRAKLNRESRAAGPIRSGRWKSWYPQAEIAK